MGAGRHPCCPRGIITRVLTVKLLLAVATSFVAGFCVAEVRNGHAGWAGLGGIAFIGTIIAIIWLEDQIGRGS